MLRDKINKFFGDTFHKKVFFICLIVSIVLIVVSWIMPPAWIIDTSVLAATGELFGFASLSQVMAAIESGGIARLQKGDISLEVSQREENKEE